MPVLRAAAAVDSRVKAIPIDKASVTTTATTEDADATSVVAADVSKTVRADRAVAAAIREEEEEAPAENKAVDSAHRWLPSYRMERRQDGLTRSATADSFDAPRTATWPSRVMHTSRCR